MNSVASAFPAANAAPTLPDQTVNRSVSAVLRAKRGVRCKSNGARIGFLVAKEGDILGQLKSFAYAKPSGGVCLPAEFKSESSVQLGEVQYFVESDQLCDADGTQIYLRLQSSQVLRYLVDHLGALISRDELIQKIWHDLAVTDDSLTQCVADIRRAIGDKDRTILKTVPKRGFVLAGQARPRMQIDRMEPVAAPAPGHQLFEATATEVVVTVASSHPEIGAAFDAMLARGVAKPVAGSSREHLQYRFPNDGQALGNCINMALRHSAAICLESGHSANDRSADLFALVRPGEVLATASVRDAAISSATVEFEDLGHLAPAADKAPLRVYRVNRKASGQLVSSALDRPMLPTIAVLPLHQLNDDDPSNVLGSVFADVMTMALGGSEEINVTSRLSTVAFGNRDAELTEVGRLLNADFVLSGFYIRRDDRVILNLEFADVSSQRMLWSHRMEIPVEVLLREFDAVHEIVAKIRRAIVINEIRRIKTRPLETLQDYSLLFAAVGLMHRLSPNDFYQSRELLDLLIQRAPTHPIPLAWSARWHVLRVMQGWSDNINQDGLLALDCTKRALDIDPENVTALVSEGSVLTNLLHRLDEAEERYDIALTHNPNDSYGLVMLGILKAFQDRGEEGENDTERAMHLAPLDPHRFFYLALGSGASLAAENDERAVQLGQASMRLNQTHASTLRTLAVAYLRSGRLDEAQQTMKQLFRQQPNISVSGWLAAAPSADFEVGRKFAQDLRRLGVPE